MEKSNKVLIPIAIVVAGLLLGGAIFFSNQGKTETSLTTVLSPQEAAEKAIKFINENLLVEGMSASFSNVTEESGIYKLIFKIQDQEYISFVTKDGKILFPEEGVNLETALTQKEPEAPVEIPKSDRPDVKLFVMSYCPYGLQAQKMFLPVYNSLKDKVDMGVYFVSYIMHDKQEIDENLRQYCIQKEQKEKYYDYLSCFVEAGEFEECLDKANVDKDKMNACIAQTDKNFKVTELYNDKGTWLSGYYPKFDVQSDLNEKYGVQGSPTVVINDTVVNINPRTPEKFKEIICQAFNEPPEECNQTLSEELPASGFGSKTGSSSGGACQ